MRVAERTPSSWLRRQLRITWHLPAVLAALFLVLAVGSNWNWLSSTRPRVITLQGTHGEIGLSHGQLLAKEIRFLFDRYIVGGLVEREGWTLEDLVAIGIHYEQYIPVAYIEEMKGIARSSGVPYEHILAMNTFPDAVLGAQPQACSAFAVRTGQGILVGRNLDWTNFGVAHRHAVVFLIEPSPGHRVLNVAWPGMVGAVTGMNDQGLTVSLNMAYAMDLDNESTPFLLRLREILETQSTIDGAAQSLIGQPRTFAANILLASASENTAAVVEVSGHRHAVVPMDGDLLITTNYFQSLDIRGGAGADRTAALSDYLSRSGRKTSPRRARRALARVCFRGSSLGMVTNQSVVFAPERLTADVALGKVPASSGRFYTVSFPE